MARSDSHSSIFLTKSTIDFDTDHSSNLSQKQHKFEERSVHLEETLHTLFVHYTLKKWTEIKYRSIICEEELLAATLFVGGKEADLSFHVVADVAGNTK